MREDPVVQTEEEFHDKYVPIQPKEDKKNDTEIQRRRSGFGRR